MSQDFSGLQADLRAMEERLMGVMASIRADIAGIDRRIEYLGEQLLAPSQQRELRRVAAAGDR